jgi:hypothetical protein
MYSEGSGCEPAEISPPRIDFWNQKILTHDWVIFKFAGKNHVNRISFCIDL